MAVYGRNKEKWDPTKPKAKGTKNRTYQLKKSSSLGGTFSPDGKLFFYMGVQSISEEYLLGTKITNSAGTSIVDYSMKIENSVGVSPFLSPDIINIESSKFSTNALHFNSSGSDRSYVLPSTGNSSNFTMSNLISDSSRTDTYISFWLKLDQKNWSSSFGQSFGGLYRVGLYGSGSTDNEEFDDLQPAMLFMTNSTGGFEVKIYNKQTDDTPAGAEWDESFIRYTSSTSEFKIPDNEWVFVTILLRELDDWTSGVSSEIDIENCCTIFFNGHPVTTTSDVVTPDSNSVTASPSTVADGAVIEPRIGNTSRTFPAGASYNVESPNIGFDGAIGEFLIFSQDTKLVDGSGTQVDTSRYSLVKFLYEAQTEGAYHLHSGVHSSSPRLEQFDLDNDSAFPDNFTMPVYTKFKSDEFYDAARDYQVSLRSENRFTEGAITDPTKSPSYDPLDPSNYPGEVEVWQENASQYFVQTEYDASSNTEESINLLPHLRLNPADTILTNGNWYSDARSEFFTEDLDPINGFVISNKKLISGLLSSTNTVEVSTTANMEVGQALTKIDGTGSFNSSGVTIASIDAENNTITTSGNHVATGDILFSVDGKGITAQLTGAQPVISDELYREHYSTEKVIPFIDENIPNEYKDCLVIEIPIPVAALDGAIGGPCILSTDAEDHNESREVAEFKFKPLYNIGDGNGVYDPSQDSGQKINTMAYYNFKNKKWEHTVPSYGTYNAKPISLAWTGNADIGFAPLSGLVFPKNERLLPYFSSLYGRPVTDYGFPFHRKFESEEGQAIDMSKYIDKSVILEGWEIYTKVVPRTGYSQDHTGAPVNTADGYEDVYGGDTSFDLAGAAGISPGGKSPLYFGATGEACVFWDQEGVEAIPFVEKTALNSNNQHFRYDNTIPISNFNSDGVEQTPSHTSKGLVTKGVTAFLLKETDLFDHKIQRGKWLRTQPRFIAGNGNSSTETGFEDNTDTYSAARSFGFSGAMVDYRIVDDSAIDAGGTGYHNRFPPLNFDFYLPKTSDASLPVGTLASGFSSTGGQYTRGSSRELIGYLQHIYHNDPNPVSERSYWQRFSSSNNTFYGIKPSYRGQKNIIGQIERDGQSYVSNLLRENTSEYTFHVSGSMKMMTPYAGSMPISNFKIAGSSENNGVGKLGVYEHDIDTGNTATGIDLYQSYSIIPSCEGSTFSEFIQHDAAPNIPGRGKPLEVYLPEGFYPSRVPSDDAVIAHWKSTAQSPFQISINPDPETDVILRPTDRLILGIQDSISTTFASQQMQHNDSPNNSNHVYKYVKWGRNYLKIPEQNDAYLRLYIRKTRDGKPFNFISDESRYNQNVNRDLGDHMNDDEFMINPPLMYSGSMADDIMGPTTFTPPLMTMTVNPYGTIGEDALDVSQIEKYAQNVDAFHYGETLGKTDASTQQYWGGSVSGGYRWKDAGFVGDDGLGLPWNSLSGVVFKDRDQYTNLAKRPPAITWRNALTDAFDKKGPVPNASNWTSGQPFYQGARSTYAFLEAIQWVITEPNPNKQTHTTGVMGGSDENSHKWITTQVNSDHGDYNETYGASYASTDFSAPKIDPFWFYASTGWNPHGPLKFRFQPFCKLSELNSNDLNGSGRTTTGHVVIRFRENKPAGAKYWANDVSLVGDDSPGISAWSSNIVVPVFDGKTGASNMIPFINAMKVEFRLVVIQQNEITTGAASDQSPGLIPKYSDGVQMSLGDVFYFDNNQNAIKLKSATELQTPSNVTAAQRWARNWYNQRSTGPRLFIVAAAAKVSSTFIETTGHSYLTWKEINEKIADTLKGQQSIDSGSLLYSIDNSTTAVDGKFTITYPQDPVLRDTLSRQQQKVNDDSAFKLCGQDVSSNSTDGTWPANILDDRLMLYIERPAGTTPSTKAYSFPVPTDNEYADHTMVWFGGDLGFAGNYTAADLVDSGGSDNEGDAVANLSKQNLLLMTGNYDILLNDAGGTTTNFAYNYLTPLKSITKSAAATVAGVLDTYYTGPDANIPNIDHIKINYSGLSKQQPQLSIVEETYSDIVDRRIDRFVQRRTTELYNKTDATKPLVPGPFGSFRNYRNLISRNIIFDSLPAKSLSADMNGYCSTFTHRTREECIAAEGTWVDTDYMTLLSDIPQAFPFEASEERTFDVVPNAIKVKMRTAVSGGVWAQEGALSLSSTIVTTNQTADSTVGNYSWGFSTNSNNDWDEGGLGLLNITNYIQDEFKGASDFTKKSVRDVLVGFGNASQGRNVIRPDLYHYQAWTGLTPIKFAAEWIIDPPRGARFGQYNTTRMGPTYKFNYRHFGHMRDMLEQAIDTKFINHVRNESAFGSPVVVTAINSANPEIPKLIANTSRYNKTKNATVTKPYIENNYEGIAQPTNLNSESLRVDVAGSIRSRGIASPSSMAANIRSRG